MLDRREPSRRPTSPGNRRTPLAGIVAPLLATVVVGCGADAHPHTASRGDPKTAPASREVLGTAIAERVMPNAPAAYVACYIAEIDALSPTAFARFRAEMTGPVLHKVPADVEKLDIGCIKDPATLRLARRQLAAQLGAYARRRGFGKAYGACVSRVVAHLPLPRVRRIVAAPGGQPATLLGDVVRRTCGRQR